VITGDPGSGQPPGAAPTGVGAGGSVGATQGGRPHDVAQDGIDADGTLGQPPGAAPTGVGAGGSVGATQGGRPEVAAPTNADTRDRAPPLGQIVGWFKTMTTNEYIRGVKQQGWPPFPGKVWQRNYYEHIIRNRDALGRIRVYIQTNPQRWALDRENPHCDGLDELESWIYGPS
jgi:hypothetical protein